MRKKIARILRRVLAVVLAMVITIEILPMGVVNVYAADNGKTPTTDDANKIKLNEWLKYMPDDMPVSRINMLASHDSGCYNPAQIELIGAMYPVLGTILAIVLEVGKELSKTQNLTITEQLEKGVRVFDIRGGYEFVNSETDPLDMIVNHGGVPMVKNKSDLVYPFLTIGDTINEINQFLIDNPSETVIVNFDHEELPVIDYVKDKSKYLLEELIKQFPKASEMEHHSGRFFYFENGAEVPTLGAVRGKCIVLNAQKNPLTPYENNWSVSAFDKKNYISHFFETHNSTDGQIKYTNKDGLYKKDHFTKEKFENKTENENDPQVKVVNYSANKPPASPPPVVAALVKTEYKKAKYYKQDTRYGWIGNDFIGMDDPTDAIIYSNVGCTNFYANIDTGAVIYDATSLLDYVLYIERDGKIEPINLYNNDKYKAELTNDGKKIQIKVIGLPLYAQNGERCKYRLGMTNEIFALEESDSKEDTKYSIADEKWCGQKIYKSYEAKKNVFEIPMEVEWKIDDEVKEYIDFKIPENHTEFFEVIDSLVYKQTTATGEQHEIKLYGPFDTDANIHLGTFTKVGDAANLYKTSVVNLPKNSNKGEDYSYKLDRAVIRNQGQKGYYITTNITKGTEGCERLVVNVQSITSKKEVPGKIIWHDMGDLASKREDAFNNVFYPSLEVKKINDEHSKFMYENTHNPYNVQKGEKDTEFSTMLLRMHPSGVEYNRYEYLYPDKLLYNINDSSKLTEEWEPGYYRKKESETDASQNKIAYELFVKADVNVVFNTATETELSELGISDKLGVCLKREGRRDTFTSVKPDGGDKKYWKSEEISSGISIEDAHKYSVDTTFFKKSTPFDDISDIDLERYFYLRVGRVVSTDNNGFPFIHYMLYCDSKKLEGEPIYGTVTWIDGGIASHPKNQDLALKVEQKVEGEGDWTTVPSTEYDLVWIENSYYVYETGTKHGLPDKTPEGKDIAYRIVAPDDFNGYELEQNEYDIKYVKYVDVRVYEKNGNPINPEDVKIYQNGAELCEGIRKDHQPIADDDNVPYTYTATVDSAWIVQYLGSNYNDDTSMVSIGVAIYRPAGKQIDLPVNLENEGKSSSESYCFKIDGAIDLDLPDLELNDSKPSDKFTINSDELTKDGYTYHFDISQIAANTGDIEYDEHISSVNIKSIFDDYSSAQIISVEWENDAEQVAGASLFKNKICYEPVVLDLDGLVHKSEVKTPNGLDAGSAFPNEFTYQLLDKQGEDCFITLDQTKISDEGEGEKAIRFTEHPVKYYEPGDYTLYVTCVANTSSGSSGWNYDSKLYSVNFKVVPNADNSGLKIQDITYEKETITQLYSVIEYSIPVKHEIKGEADSTEFKFNIEDMFGPTSDTKSIIGEGHTNFAKIKYYAPGEYYYNITEMDDNNPDWEYDDTIIAYRVLVASDSEGNLKVTSDDTPTFTSASTRKHEPLTVQWIDCMEDSAIESYRPSQLKFNLYGNGSLISSVGSIEGSAQDNEWKLDKITSEPLPHYEIVEGVRTPITYTVQVADNGADFENNYATYCFGTGDGTLSILCIDKRLETNVDIAVRTEWNDGNNKDGIRPESVFVEVIPNPDLRMIYDIDSQEMSESNGWRTKFNQLPGYILDDNKKAKKVNYSLSPMSIDGYDVLVSYDDMAKEYVIKYTPSDDMWIEGIPDQVYTGKALRPTVHVYSGAKLLTKGKDYTLKYANNKRVGFATVTVVGKGNYKGTDSAIFNINPKDITEEDVYVSIADKNIKSKNHISKPVIKYNGMTLKQGRDYTVEYSGDMTREGLITVQITGTGHNYNRTKTVTYKIYNRSNDFSKMYVEKIPNQIFTGERIYLTPDAVKVYTDKNKTKQLEFNKDFTVSYVNNTKVGTAKAVIKGIGEYELYGGTKVIPFKIVPKELTDADIKIIGDTTYSGGKLKPEIEVYLGSKRIDPRYYTVTYKNNIAAVSVSANKAPTVQIKGKGNYSKIVAKKFAIEPLELAKDDVNVTIPLIKKSGEQVTIADVKPSIKRGKVTLKLGKDFTVDDITPIDDTYHKVKISFTGNYKGNIESVARVYSDSIQISLNLDDFTVNVTDMKHTGKAVRPKVEVIDNITGKKVNSSYYNITYANNIDFSDTAPTVTIEGKGLYKGSITKNFRIYLNDISKTYVAKIPDQMYTGKQVTISANDIKVYINKRSEEPLIQNTDYTVEYGENVRIGKGTIIINGIGNYGGRKKVKFLILPKNVVWYIN